LSHCTAALAVRTLSVHSPRWHHFGANEGWLSVSKGARGIAGTDPRMAQKLQNGSVPFHNMPTENLK